MTTEHLIPSIRLGEADTAANDRFDVWREAVRDVYDVVPVCDERVGDESLDAWLLDNLIFSEVAFSAQSFSHRACHAENSDYLSLQIYKEGGSRGTVGDTSFEMTPGTVQIYDFSRVFHSVAERSVVAGVIVPHEAVGYDRGRHPALMSFDGNSPVGRYLARSFFALLGQLPSLPLDEANVLSSGFCGLLRGLLQGDEPASGGTREFRTQRRRAMLAYLDSHLSDPNLGIDRLCRTFNVSRASIYRDFAEAGGVGQYITQRRLDRCLHQLLSTPGSRGRVQEIAARWGFDDPGYFSRLFRKRFGVSPSTALGRAGAPGAEQLVFGDRQLLSTWLKAI